MSKILSSSWTKKPVSKRSNEAKLLETILQLEAVNIKRAEEIEELRRTIEARDASLEFVTKECKEAKEHWNKRYEKIMELEKQIKLCSHDLTESWRLRTEEKKVAKERYDELNSNYVRLCRFMVIMKSITDGVSFEEEDIIFNG
jgi:chromosome segregation ATPase